MIHFHTKQFHRSVFCPSWWAVLTLIMVTTGWLLGGCQEHSSGGDAAAPAGKVRPASEAALDRALEQHGLRGKVVLVQFGMVGCTLSDQGLGRMIGVQKSKSLPDLGLLRVEQGNDEDTIKAYYKDKAPPFPVLYDKEAALAQAVGATAYPSCILVDKFGHVRYRGRYPETRLDEWVEMLASEKADPGTETPLLGAVTLDIPKLMQRTNLPELSPSAKVNSLSSYKGQAGLLVIFVDTNCPFSAEAMADMPKVAPQLAAMKIPTVLVNIDDARDAVQKHYAKQTLGVPVLYDVTTATKNNWGIESVPTLVYITPDQQVGYNGKAVWKDLASAIEKNLKLQAGTINFAAKGTGFG